MAAGCHKIGPCSAQISAGSRADLAGRGPGRGAGPAAARACACIVCAAARSAAPGEASRRRVELAVRGGILQNLLHCFPAPASGQQVSLPACDRGDFGAHGKAHLYGDVASDGEGAHGRRCCGGRPR